MNRRDFISTAVAGLAASPLAALAQNTIKAKDLSADLFKPVGPIPTIQIELDKANQKQLNSDPRKYVKAKLTVGDIKLEDVGLHLKGAAGSFRGWDDKPALTINCDKFKDDQLFKGMDKFHLNNSVQDGAYLNEIITCEAFREAGVPAARGCHVLVELNGRKAGLYLLKEGFDPTFLKHHFENNKGNLYDGGFLMDVDQDLHHVSGPGGGYKDLKALAAAARERDPKKRLEELDKTLNLEKFYAFWALEVLGCDWDGYCRNRNNYRLYHDPKSDKFVFFAHGKDQMFQNPGDALVHGWGGLIARRIYETEEGRKKYLEALKKVTEKIFTKEKLTKRIDELAPRMKDALNAVFKGQGDQVFNEAKGLKERVKQRMDYIAKELPKLKV